MLPVDPESRPRILIIEDYPHAREGLTKFFRRQGWDSVAAADSIEAHQHIHSSVQTPPDVYLIDLRLPGEPGPTIIRIIRLAGLRSPRTGLPVRIVAYTCLDDNDHQVAAAVDAGASAVVFKTSDFDHLVAVCQGSHPGDVAIPAPTGDAAPCPPAPAP